MTTEQEIIKIESILSAITEKNPTESDVKKDLMEFAVLTDAVLSVITDKATAIAGLQLLKLFLEKICLKTI